MVKKKCGCCKWPLVGDYRRMKFKDYLDFGCDPIEIEKNVPVCELCYEIARAREPKKIVKELQVMTDSPGASVALYLANRKASKK